MNNQSTSISMHETLILQQLSEAGEEELDYIAMEVHQPQRRILSYIQGLRRKGLVEIYKNRGEMLISLTRQGRQFLRYSLPEAYA